MGNLISVQEDTVLFCQEGGRVLLASVVLLVTCAVNLDDGLLPSAPVYCSQTRENAVWAADVTQTRCLHTANCKGSCSGLLKCRGDSKAGVSLPAGHKQHGTQCKNTSACNLMLTSVLSPCKRIEQGREQTSHGILQCLEETGRYYAVLNKPTAYAWSSMSFPMITLTMTSQNW